MIAMQGEEGKDARRMQENAEIKAFLPLLDRQRIKFLVFPIADHRNVQSSHEIRTGSSMDLVSLGDARKFDYHHGEKSYLPE